MKILRTVLAALLSGTFFFACDTDNPVENKKTQQDLTISFTVRRERSWSPLVPDGEEKKCLVYADIKRSGTPVADATVLVNGTTIPFEGTIFKQYYSELDYSTLKPGEKFKCSITINGQTAEEEVVFIGNITSSTDGASVSWQHDGNGDFIYVQEIESESNGMLSSNATYESSYVSSDLSSPANIPASAYPKAATAYLQTTVIKKSVFNAFSSLSPQLATLIAIDMTNVKINK